MPRVAVERAGEEGCLETHSQPEVRRVALDQLVLRLKALPEGVVPGKTAAEACAALPEPPDPESVQIAATSLMSIGALEKLPDKEDEVLTDLGAVLARLPVDARLGKLCVLGCVFDGCLDAALTVAAALGNRSPFLSPLERREQADASKRAFCAYDGGPRTAVIPICCVSATLMMRTRTLVVINMILRERGSWASRRYN